MNMQTAQIMGITNKDIQEMFEKAIASSNIKNPSLMYFDASYMYTFHLDDFPYIKKLNMLMRYDVDPKTKETALAIEWHRLLERWYNDQTVRDNFGNELKPIKISRSIDRVVNRGMEIIAQSLTGSIGNNIFEYRSIGDGDISEPSPSDNELSNMIDIININDAPEGGSLSRDGTTIYSVGNHSKTVPTPIDNEFTECGMHDSDNESIWNMLDHSVFQDPVPHTQNADAPGSTTVIYMCSS
jgi:hypothetical protein